jgi:hypothetical protein
MNDALEDALPSVRSPSRYGKKSSPSEPAGTAPAAVSIDE